MTSELDPIELFQKWHTAATLSGIRSQPNAACLSTVDQAGNPRARIVEIKRVRDGGFVFSTSLRSPKSHEIRNNSSVSLTFWWDDVGRQVRVVGVATSISDNEADELFAQRSRSARVASWAFEQSAPIPADCTRDSLYSSAEREFEGVDVPRPAYWSGYHVSPTSMEFLEFDESRIHHRVLYRRREAGWEATELQP